MKASYVLQVADLNCHGIALPPLFLSNLPYLPYKFTRN